MGCISSPQTAKRDLPLFLSGQGFPSNPTDGEVGTASYTRQPEAVILGLGYVDEVVYDIRLACKAVTNPVPWILGGLPQAKFDEVIKEGRLKAPSEQGPETAGMVKKALLRVKEDGGFGVDGLWCGVVWLVWRMENRKWKLVVGLGGVLCIW